MFFCVCFEYCARLHRKNMWLMNDLDVQTYMSESLPLQKHKLVKKVYSNTFQQVLSKGHVLY